MLRNENFILKMLSLFKIDRTQTRRQHHVSAEQSSPSWIAFVLKRHSLEFVVQHRNVFRYNFILVRRSMATLMGACTGRIIYTREELDTWVREHMAALIQCGRLFNKDAYKECCKMLKRFKAVGAIIPEDEEADMERLMNRFMLLSEEQGNTTLTNRTLFDGIQILIGDSDHVPAPSKATAQAPDESVGQGSRMEMLSLHLERIIAKAAVQGDETLTREHAGKSSRLLLVSAHWIEQISTSSTKRSHALRESLRCAWNSWKMIQTPTRTPRSRTAP